MLIIQKADGTLIMHLPEKDYCGADSRHRNPTKMSFCPICEVDFDGKRCVPEMCPWYQEG